MSSTLAITVVVPVKNEERNLRQCLGSVAWAGQVFVVDSQSTDRTCEIAEEMGAEVVQFYYDGSWPKKKNWAIRNLPICTEWILILDADERVTPELRAEITEAIQRRDVDGYYVRWQFIFLGRWMKHCWSHGWMLRLFRRGKGEYEDLGMRDEGGWDNEVHENILVDGRVARLQNWLMHKSNQTLSYWIRKHNEFSDWEAARWRRSAREEIGPLSNLFASDPRDRRRWLRSIFVRLPARPLFMFMYLYFWKLGVLDGKGGFYFCALHAAHQLHNSAKLYDLQRAEEEASDGTPGK